MVSFSRPHRGFLTTNYREWRSFNLKYKTNFVLPRITLFMMPWIKFKHTHSQQKKDSWPLRTVKRTATLKTTRNKYLWIRSRISSQSWFHPATCHMFKISIRKINFYFLDKVPRFHELLLWALNSIRLY